MEKYDIFISYRRLGGAQYARILQLALQQRGYKVFLDYDELTDGVFADYIKEAIKNAPIFMLILSKHSMDNCVNEEDWVRKEILLAIEENKHIIPINPDNTFDGFPNVSDERIYPALLKDTITNIQYSEISFGQALGATLDLMIKHRLHSTLGERNSTTLTDSDSNSSRLNRIQRVWIPILVFVTIFLALFFSRGIIDNSKIERQTAYLHEKYRNLNLVLNSDLTIRQLNSIDRLLSGMVEVKEDSLLMSQYEFTIGLWNGINNIPYEDREANLPKANVSYAEIYMFIGKLSDMTNLDFALPSLEEWIYAANGGRYKDDTVYAGSDDVESVAWYKDNSDGKLHSSDGLQGKDPNSLDIYDMSGNVSEICNTQYPGENLGLYVACGGNFKSHISDVGVLSCRAVAADFKDESLGFRLVIHI